MKHLTIEQAHQIFEWRLDREPMTWAQVSAELGISAGRIRAERKTKGYLETAFAYLARYGYGTHFHTLEQVGCQHPDTATMPETEVATTKYRMNRENAVYDDGGRAEFDTRYRDSTHNHVGDCVIRAIAIATGVDYKDVWTTLEREQQKADGRSVDAGTDDGVFSRYLKSLGWTRIACDRGLKDKRATALASVLSEDSVVFCQPGPAFFAGSGHCVASVQGKLRDTWYSGEDGVSALWVDATRAAHVTEALFGTTQLPENTIVETGSHAYELLLNEALNRMHLTEMYIDVAFSMVCKERNVQIRRKATNADVAKPKATPATETPVRETDRERRIREAREAARNAFNLA